MGSRKGKGLKAALTSQQSRFKAKKKLLDGAKVSEERLRRTVSSSARHIAQEPSLPGQTFRSKKVQRPFQKPTIPFKPTNHILLVGEGNFSFARALIDDPPEGLAPLSPQNITATGYDTEEECYVKHPASRLAVSFLRDCGVEIIFGVDATRLEKHASLKGKRWDRIVWNFPHAGKGITDQDRNVLSNQLLILGFLRSAAKVLRNGPIPSVTGSARKKVMEDGDSDNDTSSNEDDVENPTSAMRGTVLITLRNVVPYTLWNVPSLAKNPPAPTGSTPANPHYILLRSFQFHRNIWKGYEHSMTKGERAHGTGTTGEGGEDRTWEFFLRD